jgi:[acyl-carrier-protein] S-malonyltransferase
VVGQLSEATGRDLAGLLLEADAETLRSTRNAQLAAFTLSLVILAEAGRAGLSGVPVGAYAGHSLGEYTALVAAGALSPEMGARLVADRGEAMQSAADQSPGTMAAVLGLSPELVAQACEATNEAWVANDNAPGQVVIAGSSSGVEIASRQARALGAKKVVALSVGGAFHSPLMAPAQVRLDAALDSAELGRSKTPVVTNVDGEEHRDGWRELLAAQLCAPVRWRESLLRLSHLGADRFLELGPGTELSGMVKRTLPGAARANVATPADLETMPDFLVTVPG